MTSSMEVGQHRPEPFSGTTPQRVIGFPAGLPKVSGLAAELWRQASWNGTLHVAGSSTRTRRPPLADIGVRDVTAVLAKTTTYIAEGVPP